MVGEWLLSESGGCGRRGLSSAVVAWGEGFVVQYGANGARRLDGKRRNIRGVGRNDGSVSQKGDGMKKVNGLLLVSAFALATSAAPAADAAARYRARFP